MKKVIFVGGTAFSGSTFFHLMLANDPKGFALGEIYTLLHPKNSEQANRLCGCGDPSCTLWEKIRKNGPAHVYETVFDLHPDVEYIVDSSKYIFWMLPQAEHLSRRNIGAENILIWKTPIEFAASAKKRNSFDRWDTRWINYHRMYFSLIDNWKSVACSQLTKNPAVLRRACEHVGIPWFDGKEVYWTDTSRYHPYGGNRSATFHLYDQEKAQVLLQNHHDANKMRQYRSIYQTKVEDVALEQAVQQSLARYPLFQPIQQVLEEYSVVSDVPVSTDLATFQVPQWLIELRRLKFATQSQVNRYRLQRERVASG